MLEAVNDILRRRGIEGWLVGGSVRDRRLGRESPDLDIVVTSDPAAVAAEMAAALRVPWFTLSERHPAYRVVGREGHADVVEARGGSILEDLAERDFTINAMALPIGDGPARLHQLIDPFGGMDHLREKRLVAVSEHIFADDPLRLMRAARFSHLLGFELDPTLVVSVHAHAGELTRAAAERITSEIVLTFGGGRSAEAVRLWRDLGLLGVLLPELAGASVSESTLDLLERLDEMIERPAVWFPSTEELLGARLTEPVDGAVARPAALRLAGLMHMVGEAGSIAAGRRLKLSGEMISLLRTVSNHFSGERGEHQGLDGLPGAQARAEVLFLWGSAPFEPEVILIASASGQASSLPQSAGRMMALWAERFTHGVARPPVDGELLMRELGLEGGPALGRVLREVRLAWETGEATTLSRLLEVARRVLEDTCQSGAR